MYNISFVKYSAVYLLYHHHHHRRTTTTTTTTTTNTATTTNYLLHTPWCRVLLEQLTGLQLVKKFPPFHANRRFITALTSVRHVSLYGASQIQSIYPHPTSWRSILILSTHLRLGLPSGLFPSGSNGGTVSGYEGQLRIYCIKRRVQPTRGALQLEYLVRC